MLIGVVSDVSTMVFRRSRSAFCSIPSLVTCFVTCFGDGKGQREDSNRVAG
jgi:hypothetical protein